MGLDAFVHCNCHAEGKASPFPLPELEQYFKQHKNGHLSLTLDDIEFQDAHQRAMEWMETACEHHHMLITFEHISNWTGYRYLRQALEDIGWSHFPALFAELPESNGGYTTATQAEKVLEELALFRKLASGRNMPFLVDTKTDAIIHSYVAVYEGVFMWAGAEDLCFGIDPDGFFIAKIRDRNDEDLRQLRVDTSQIFFRSTRFEQRILEVNENDKPQKIEYFDANNENRFICGTAVALTTIDEEGNIEQTYPQLLQTEFRKVDDSEHDYQLNALEAVCKASIETGNSIVWC